MLERSQVGKVLWITGFSASGKTTLAKALMPHMDSSTVLLDGDALREVLDAEQGNFDLGSRLSIARIYARLARMLAQQGHTVIVATISLFHELHTWNREHLPGYIEIWLDVTEHERRRRDPKGLYTAADLGHIEKMATECMCEQPVNPHLTLRIEDQADMEGCVRRVLALIPTV